MLALATVINTIHEKDHKIRKHWIPDDQRTTQR